MENLKPICSICNLSMGSQNLEEFKRLFFSPPSSEPPHATETSPLPPERQSSSWFADVLKLILVHKDEFARAAGVVMTTGQLTFALTTLFHCLTNGILPVDGPIREKIAPDRNITLTMLGYFIRYFQNNPEILTVQQFRMKPSLYTIHVIGARAFIEQLEKSGDDVPEFVILARMRKLQ